MDQGKERTDRFLDSYGNIERFLRKYTQSDKDIRFYGLIEKAGRSNRAVRALKDDLKEIGDLRNAIVHERGTGEAIAVPNEKAVNLIEKLRDLVTAPPKVIPIFQRDVYTCNSKAPIAIALKAMYKYRYSQIPIIQDNKFVKLLTANTVTNWLGSCIADEIFSVMETAIDEVCVYVEDEDNYVIISQDTNVFELIERFQEYEYAGRKLEAVLITRSGKISEHFLGIATVWDLPRIYEIIKR